MSRERIHANVVRALRRRSAEQGIDVLLKRGTAEPSVPPQPVGHSDRIDSCRLPPRRLIAVPVNLTMVSAAERHHELVAGFPAQRSRLHEPEVMRFGRLALASKTGLRRHEPQMRAITIAARFANGQGTLVDMPDNGVVHRRQWGVSGHLGLRRLGQL
jgi:hypothetical protein